MDERTAVVTGGGTGIGRAIAGALAADGCRVLLVGRRAHVLDAAAESINAQADGNPVTSFTADVTSPDAVGALAEHVAATFGVLDVLVNNAGGARHQPIETIADLAAHWQETVAQNLTSAVITTAALRGLLRRPGGRVVAVSSKSALGAGGEVAYASAKAAMNRWIVTLATELGPDGITANVVSPGFVPDTELYGPNGPDPAWNARIVRGIAATRVGTPADVASAVRYITSPEASWITGSRFDVDGGVRAAL
jgi:3-oxoacyl-[acyl-carrier protein] reductase